MVGGLFFLRFVCPALTVPTEMGVWEGDLTVEAKRALLLITKILMNLSNGVRFGKKVREIEIFFVFVLIFSPCFPNIPFPTIGRVYGANE